MRAARRCTIPLVVATLVFAGLAAGTASADDLGVLQAITKQANKLSANHDFRYVQKLKGVHSRAAARKAEGPIRHTVSLLRSAAKYVDRNPGSTKAGKAGKADWVAGTRKLAYGYTKLLTACIDLEHGRGGAADAAALRGIRAFRNADTQLARAKRELKKARQGL